MVNKIETLETFEGNTKTSKVQCNQLKNWCFTYNNYENTVIERLETIFKVICDKYCFQEETGEEGTRHLQGVISLKKPMRWTEFDLPKQIHWEKCKSLDKSIDYCSKPETRTGKTYSMGVTLKRVPKPIKDPLANKQLRDFQKDILDIIKTEPDDRAVYWFWEKNGNVGKSALFKHIIINNINSACVVNGKCADILNGILEFNKKHGDYPEIILVDIPRTCLDYVSFSAIEMIKNGLVYSGKFEGGQILMNPPHIICVANEPPDTSVMSADRWRIKEIILN